MIKGRGHIRWTQRIESQVLELIKNIKTKLCNRYKSYIECDDKYFINLVFGNRIWTDISCYNIANNKLSIISKLFQQIRF